jgi:hypothetical protein
MDDRFRALDAWLRTALDGAPFRMEPASADASFRRYFRVFLEGGKTLIAMDAPPQREEFAPLRPRGEPASRGRLSTRRRSCSTIWRRASCSSPISARSSTCGS